MTEHEIIHEVIEIFRQKTNFYKFDINMRNSKPGWKGWI